jgi:hypothetical protein
MSDPKVTPLPYEVTVTKLPTMAEQADFAEALRKRSGHVFALPPGTKMWLQERARAK